MGKTDPRFSQSEGENIFNGNELLIKGALEAGVSLYSSYPGSPVAETLDVIRANAALFNEHGIVAAIANNEALAAARLNGSQALPLRALGIMKSVGLNVASDVLEVSNLAGANPGGGAVVIVGDDPHCSSTQTPADSRYKSRALFMPVVSPGGWQEMKDWIELAFQLSAASECYVTYLVTTSQADGGGVVRLKPDRWPEINRNSRADLDTAGLDLGRRVMIPPSSSRGEVHLLGTRLPAVTASARQLGFDRIINPPPGGARAPLGLVTHGVSYLYVLDALNALGLAGRIPVLKLGLVWPLDSEILAAFSRSVESLVVVEEKGPFVEDQIKVILRDLALNGGEERLAHLPVWGKRRPDGGEAFPASRGLGPSQIISVLGPVLRELYPEAVTAVDRQLCVLAEIADYRVDSPARPATFCAGCPHRDTGNLLMDIIADVSRPDYMRARHGGNPLDLVVHGDIGCYSMFNAIWDSRLMHDMSAMGQSLGAAAGLEPFVVNKRVLMLGDSTFFHGGMAGISDLARHGQDVLVFILDNDTTAMTGQHPTPGNDTDILGRGVNPQDIERVVRGIVGPEVPVATVDPSDEYAYRRTAEDYLLRPGLKVIIAKKPCAIKTGRIKKALQREVIKRRGYLPEERRINITPEVCEDCLECTRKTGCLGLERTETVLGRKVRIDPNVCVSDGSCYRVEACPSFEEMTVTRRAPRPSRTESVAFDKLPEVSLPPLDSAWRSYICGYGGQGSNTVTAVLARAGMHQGYEVTLHNRKGMAIRNGSVKSVVVFSPRGKETSPLIPEGGTQLIIGLDILETARALDAAHHISIGSRESTCAVVSDARNQTLESIMGLSDFDPRDLAGQIEPCVRPGGLFCRDVRSVAERFAGHSRYLNTVLLGAAWQKGWIPLDLNNIERALAEVMPQDERETNGLAFRLGRQLVHREAALAPPENIRTLERELEDISRWIAADPGGRKNSALFGELMAQARQRLDLPEDDLIGLAHRLEDVLQYGGEPLARKYLDLIHRAYGSDSEAEGRRATRDLIRNLHRALAVKDEVHVSHLLTSARKLERDRLEFDIDPARGDRIRYRHFTTPQLTLFGQEFRFKLTTRNWQLRIMRHLRWLRRMWPAWHAAEREFGRWYVTQVVEPFISRSGEGPSYRAFVEAINCVELAKGYREVRAPGMEAARRAVALLLRGEKAENTTAAGENRVKGGPGIAWSRIAPASRLLGRHRLLEKD